MFFLEEQDLIFIVQYFIILMIRSKGCIMLYTQSSGRLFVCAVFLPVQVRFKLPLSVNVHEAGFCAQVELSGVMGPFSLFPSMQF